jgi:plasmid stability protein
VGFRSPPRQRLDSGVFPVYLALGRQRSVAGLAKQTVYLDEDLRRVLQAKAATEGKSLSRLVNEAVRQALGEEAEDLAAFAAREAEPAITLEQLLAELR